MATKTITLKGGQLVDTTDTIVGWVADDSSGLKFVADPASGDAQSAYSSLTHMVTETSNPLWNQVRINQSRRDTTASSLFDGHITLQGIKPDGTVNDIMEERFTATSATETDDLHTFELLGSNCTNDMYKQVPDGATSAGTIDVNLPLRYGKYEDVDIVGAWFDTAWQYRIAISLERTHGQLHGAHGHNGDYYGNIVYVPYSANMASTTQADVRFVAPDGVTELPFYQFDVVDSVSASYIVMVPWGFMDKEVESTPYQVTGYTFNYPQYVHCYYGNAAATSASDVSLGGHALFYDDFEDQARSDAMWTLNTAANQTSVIENGYLELRSAASQTSEANAFANMDFNAADPTSWEIIWKIIYDTPAYTNTTTSNGPYIRIRGQGAESDSYWEVKHFYIAAGAGESTLNPAGHMWGKASADSGVVSTTAYANNITSAVGDDQYIKFRWNKRDSTGTNTMQFFQSDDGVHWNCIGDVSGYGTVFDTVPDLEMALYYVGKSGVAADKYIRFESIVAYPIMSGTVQHIAWEESFQNGIYFDRYDDLNVTAGQREITETQDLIKFENKLGYSAIWSTATKNGLCLTLGGGLTGINYNQNDVLVYECTVAGLTENAAAGVVMEAGLAVSDRVGTTSADAGLFGIRWVATGAARTFWRETFIAGTSDLSNSFDTWTQADFPIGLRMVFHQRDRCVYYQTRKYGTDDVWYTQYVSPTAWQRWITGGYSIPMLYYRNATTNSGQVYFSNWRWSNGGGIIDCNGKVVDKAGTVTGSWFPEEDYVNDYPLAISGTPTEDDMSLTFTCPTPNKRGNPMKLRTKEFGGDYNYSKTFYLTDKDEIEIGPAGTDQYMGMRLVFDFNMGAEDEIEFDKVEFIYEVI